MDSDRLKLPWFRFYVPDYGRLTRRWPVAARGAYSDLACVQWDEGGLPVDAADIREIVHHCSDADWAIIWPILDAAFPIVGDVRKNLALDEVRTEQINDHEKKSAAGKAGAAAR